MYKLNKPLILLFLFGPFFGCGLFDSKEAKPRLTMFVGVDISGSFMRSQNYDDALDFLAYYLYTHIHGIGGLKAPNALFVSSIGGAESNEPKTFYPKQTFENKSIEEINATLRHIFPKQTANRFTDYNAFFEQCALMVRNKNLVLRPISIVMLSDGIPDVKTEGKTDYRSISLRPLERLARNITVRLLYTDAVVGTNWQTRVPRRRVKIWTQDAEVMQSWKDPKMLLADIPIAEQPYFFDWIQDNVDFGVRARRVK
ncbi:MAG: hypothetical protein ACE5IR_07015 [bacterium]